MSTSWEVRLSGKGGQGIIFIGIVLAEAAAREGLNVVQSQVYGPESRGGASKAEVIIRDIRISYPKVTRPDVVFVMSQPAADRYASSVREGGLLAVDCTHVHRLPEVAARVVQAEVSGVARDELGREQVASAVAAGFLTGLTGMVSVEALREAISARAPRGTVDLNVKAMEAGLRLARASEQAT
jgi:2-oxoglutarate ferredoxin oxidoreductase subunit gamma